MRGFHTAIVNIRPKAPRAYFLTSPTLQEQIRRLPMGVLAELPFGKLKMSDSLLQLEQLSKDTLACKESLGSGEPPLLPIPTPPAHRPPRRP